MVQQGYLAQEDLLKHRKVFASFWALENGRKICTKSQAREGEAIEFHTVKGDVLRMWRLKGDVKKTWQTVKLSDHRLSTSPPQEDRLNKCAK